MNILEGKRIVLGVSGGIAAYKAVELMRMLQNAGADVKAVMTQNAMHFVGPMTFAAISGHPVFSEMFPGASDDPIRHISWAKDIDAVVVVPATANVIGKLANGIADDALSTFMLAVTAPKIICPAMNTHMYESRAVQRNLDQLETDGYVIVEPGAGILACGETGAGRLADPSFIFERVVDVLLPSDFFGRRVVVTAGPTREAIDPVRFISNPSSGKMGYAVARAAAGRGADVVLVSGPTALPDPNRVRTIRVTTAREMADAVFAETAHADVVIKVAAVADYRPVMPASRKVKKGPDEQMLTLEKTTDILAELGRRKREGQILVGFAAETDDLEKYARQKLDAKNLDMIAANIVGASSESGFETDTNIIKLFYRSGDVESLPVMEKSTAAHLLLDRVASLLPPRGEKDA